MQLDSIWWHELSKMQCIAVLGEPEHEPKCSLRPEVPIERKPKSDVGEGGDGSSFPVTGWCTLSLRLPGTSPHRIVQFRKYL